MYNYESLNQKYGVSNCHDLKYIMYMFCSISSYGTRKIRCVAFLFQTVLYSLNIDLYQILQRLK